MSLVPIVLYVAFASAVAPASVASAPAPVVPARTDVSLLIEYDFTVRNARAKLAEVVSKRARTPEVAQSALEGVERLDLADLADRMAGRIGDRMPADQARQCVQVAKSAFGATFAARMGGDFDQAKAWIEGLSEQDGRSFDVLLPCVKAVENLYTTVPMDDLLDEWSNQAVCADVKSHDPEGYRILLRKQFCTDSTAIE